MEPETAAQTAQFLADQLNGFDATIEPVPLDTIRELSDFPDDLIYADVVRDEDGFFVDNDVFDTMEAYGLTVRSIGLIASDDSHVETDGDRDVLRVWVEPDTDDWSLDDLPPTYSR